MLRKWENQKNKEQIIHVGTYLVVESNHFFNNTFVNGWKQSTGNELHVYYCKGIHKDLENPKITRKNDIVSLYQTPEMTTVTYVKFLFNTKVVIPQ